MGFHITLVKRGICKVWSHSAAVIFVIGVLHWLLVVIATCKWGMRGSGTGGSLWIDNSWCAITDDKLTMMIGFSAQGLLGDKGKPSWAVVLSPPPTPLLPHSPNQQFQGIWMCLLAVGASWTLPRRHKVNCVNRWQRKSNIKDSISKLNLQN